MSDPPNSGTQRSAWSVLAAAILIVLALLIAAAGVLLLNEVAVRGHSPGGSGGVFELLVGLGVGLLLVAALHLWAATSTWRGRHTPARRVGWTFVLLGGVVFGLCLISARDVAALVLLYPLAYGAILLCLSFAKREIAASDGSNRGLA